MNTNDQKDPQVETTPENDGYEPPKVETVLTAEELAREIQYAGLTQV